MKRNIIKIDEEKCTGCGLCMPNCPEGAIQMIDGKARLVSDLFCDGLGACLGHCPEGAITIEEREAEPYDEKKVMANVVTQGANVIKAHLLHLKDHQQDEFLKQALEYLDDNAIENPLKQEGSAMLHQHAVQGGCPGSRSMAFTKNEEGASDQTGNRPSQLSHWPVQLHLISPFTPQYQGADVLLSADCVAYAMGDFHKDHLKGKALAIACPKLDGNQESYLEKLKGLIDEAKINTLTVMVMEVPCCSGLLRLAQKAAEEAARKVPVKCITVGVQGDIKNEAWV